MEQEKEDLDALDKLLGELFTAKQNEQKAKDERIAAENKVIAMIGTKDEGSTTKKAIHYKTRVTYKLSRKVAWDKFDFIVNNINIPSDLMPVKYTRALDVTKLNEIESKFPTAFAAISECITISPLKSHLTCEPIEV